ncbi:putative RNA-binding protein 19 [Sciurus carolinensis]|uniref:RNA-binding protein 19 n=1 Tax=Sciurus carolinensis TaxID=30640 RepID=A0AA41SRZ1_SCICA|nr:putative RNA-binding protein 19 [Sciurus carolinensis]
MLAGQVRSQGLRLLPGYRACCQAHRFSQLEHLTACSQGLGPQPGGCYIKVFREKHMPTAKGPLQNNRTLGKNEEEEDLADSRRLFVHNLPYTSTEEDLEGLFSSYGPLSELHYPIESMTKEPKDFAFVTFGKMLHGLPSTIRKEASEDANTPGSSYKKKAASKDKASSSSSHNCNTLFMGPNAVAEVITQKYIATKSQVLDDATAERSKTMILAKNLPAGTLATELRETFGHFGSLGRVLLPKGGVTAIIVEFLEPLEFHHIPLYLKWAPGGVFSSTAPQRKELQEAPAKSAEKNEVEPEMVADCETPEGKKPAEEGAEASKPRAEKEEEEEEEDKNLPGCTLFIKNITFNTTEETLREVSIHQEWGMLQAVMQAVHLLCVPHGSGGGQPTLLHTIPAIGGFHVPSALKNSSPTASVVSGPEVSATTVRGLMEPAGDS